MAHYRCALHANTPTTSRLNAIFTEEDFSRGDISYPSPYVIPNLQYECTSNPELLSTVESPFVCKATELLRFGHLQNPVTIFGQPFSGKTCLFMRLSTKATAMYGNKHWIRMIDFRVAALNCMATNTWPTYFIQLLAKQLRVTEKSVQELFKPLHNAKELRKKNKFDKLIRGELFLDGFDEIPVEAREYFLRLIPQLKQIREECPIRIWVSCRSHFKPTLIQLLGNQSSFEIRDYDGNLQKNLLFFRWKDELSQTMAMMKHEEYRLWEYTRVMHKEFCKEIKNFETTFGTVPLYLEILSSVFGGHAKKFLMLYRKVRDDQLAGPTGHSNQENLEAEKVTTSKDCSTQAGKRRRKYKKKKVLSISDKKKETPSKVLNDGCPNVPTTQMMCQIAGLFTAEILEFMMKTIIDIYCYKYHSTKDLNTKEYNTLLDREYRRAARIYADFAVKTFRTSYQYGSLLPSIEDPTELISNSNMKIDEDLYHIGLMIVTEIDGVAQLRNRIIGDFLMAKHFACTDKMDLPDPQQDNFYLNVFSLHGKAKSARSFYDNILHFSPVEGYHPEIIRNYFMKQYKLGPGEDAEWERIRNNGSAWHLAIMEGFHTSAVAMINSFNIKTEEKQVRKLLRIKVPVQILEGKKGIATFARVDGGDGTAHLVSCWSLVAMFGYGNNIEDLIKPMITVFTREEIVEEFSTPNSWTPFHYAAMHSNLWFIMYMYNDVFLPLKIQPIPGIYNPNGQLPTHILMSYSWHHFMTLKGHYIPGYSSQGECDNEVSSDASKLSIGDDEESKLGRLHTRGRDCIYYKTMVKDLQGPGNLLRVVHHECIRQMVEYGGENIDAPEKLHGNTMLHYAAIDGCLETVRYLVENEADVQTANVEGKTPLHYAAMHGHRRIFIYLVKSGAQSTCKDNNGVSPITLWTNVGQGIDKENNDSMSHEELNFFKACKDTETLIQDQTARFNADVEGIYRHKSTRFRKLLEEHEQLQRIVEQAEEVDIENEDSEFEDSKSNNDVIEEGNDVNGDAKGSTSSESEEDATKDYDEEDGSDESL